MGKTRGPGQGLDRPDQAGDRRHLTPPWQAIVILARLISSDARERIGWVVDSRVPKPNVFYALQMVPQGHASLQRSESCCGSTVALSR